MPAIGCASGAVLRLAPIDLLKAVASQLIVLHHLAFYGPMADHARPLAPVILDWLAGPARMAVQVFLVAGGFLAARSLARPGLPAMADPLGMVARRLRILLPPYLVAIALAVAANAVARGWMTHGSISDSPTPAQLAVHAMLLQDVLGYEALSAGIWYVAIDFQLYASLTALLWLSGRIGRKAAGAWIAPVLVATTVAASLLHFNLDPAWDAWAPYFLGSYGLGAIAWWASDATRPLAVRASSLAAMLVLATFALALEFRPRIGVALAVALCLAAAGRGHGFGAPTAPGVGMTARVLGRISGAVFLVHFPVSLLVSAAFTRFASAQPAVQAIGMLLAWAASLAAGAAFHRWVERPLRRRTGAIDAREAGQSAAMPVRAICASSLDLTPDMPTAPMQ